MTAEEIRNVLGWCGLLNMGILLIWFAMFVVARDFIYRLHSRWFQLSAEKFDELHYKLIGQFKLLVLGFNIVPYLALRIVL